MKKGYITVVEAAVRLGLTEKAVDRLTLQGMLPCRRYRGKVCYDKWHVEQVKQELV